MATTFWFGYAGSNTTTTHPLLLTDPAGTERTAEADYLNVDYTQRQFGYRFNPVTDWFWRSPVFASPVTISGLISFSMNAYENAMTINAGLRAQVYRVSDGAIILTVDDGAEVSLGTPGTTMTWSGTPATGVTIGAGDRFAVRLYAVPAGGSWSASGTQASCFLLFNSSTRPATITITEGWPIGGTSSKTNDAFTSSATGIVFGDAIRSGTGANTVTLVSEGFGEHIYDHPHGPGANTVSDFYTSLSTATVRDTAHIYGLAGQNVTRIDRYTPAGNVINTSHLALPNNSDAFSAAFANDKAYLPGAAYVSGAWTAQFQSLTYSGETTSLMSAAISSQRDPVSYSPVAHGKAYFMGGRPYGGSIPVTTIDGMNYSDETTFTVSATMVAALGAMANCHSETNAYALGGLTDTVIYSTHRQKFTFSSETMGNMGAGINHDGKQGASGTEVGVNFGRYTGTAWSGLLTRVTYSSDTITTTGVGTLVTNEWASAVGGATKAYSFTSDKAYFTAYSGDTTAYYYNRIGAYNYEALASVYRNIVFGSWVGNFVSTTTTCTGELGLASGDHYGTGANTVSDTVNSGYGWAAIISGVGSNTVSDFGGDGTGYVSIARNGTGSNTVADVFRSGYGWTFDRAGTGANTVSITQEAYAWDTTQSRTGTGANTTDAVTQFFAGGGAGSDGGSGTGYFAGGETWAVGYPTTQTTTDKITYSTEAVSAVTSVISSRAHGGKWTTGSVAYVYGGYTAAGYTASSISTIQGINFNNNSSNAVTGSITTGEASHSSNSSTAGYDLYTSTKIQFSNEAISSISYSIRWNYFIGGAGVISGPDFAFDTTGGVFHYANESFHEQSFANGPASYGSYSPSSPGYGYFSDKVSAYAIDVVDLSTFTAHYISGAISHIGAAHGLLSGTDRQYVGGGYNAGASAYQTAVSAFGNSSGTNYGTISGTLSSARSEPYAISSIGPGAPTYTGRLGKAETTAADVLQAGSGTVVETVVHPGISHPILDDVTQSSTAWLDAKLMTGANTVSVSSSGSGVRLIKGLGIWGGGTSAIQLSAWVKMLFETEIVATTGVSMSVWRTETSGAFSAYDKKCYAAGGLAAGNVLTNNIYLVDTNTASNPSNNLTAVRRTNAAISGSSSYYVMCGFDGAATVSTSDSVSHFNNSASAHFHTLAVTRYGHVCYQYGGGGEIVNGFASTTGYGYIAGGISGGLNTSDIERMTHSNANMTNIAAVISVARQGGAGMMSKSSGYVAGGNGGPSGDYYNIIDKMLFSGETMSVISATLSDSYYYATGVSGWGGGYVGGGVNAGGRLNNVRKLNFTTESASDNLSLMPDAQWGMSGSFYRAEDRFYGNAPHLTVSVSVSCTGVVTDLPILYGTGSNTSADFTQAGAGNVINPRTGTGSNTVADFAGAGNGNIIAGTLGTGANTVTVTSAGNGAVLVSGTGTGGPSASSASSGTVLVSGSAGSTAGVGSSGVGTVSITGMGDQDFITFMSQAVGTVLVTGGFAPQTLEGVTVTADNFGYVTDYTPADHEAKLESIEARSESLSVVATTDSVDFVVTT